MWVGPVENPSGFCSFALRSGVGSRLRNTICALTHTVRGQSRWGFTDVLIFIKVLLYISLCLANVACKYPAPSHILLNIPSLFLPLALIYLQKFWWCRRSSKCSCFLSFVQLCCYLERARSDVPAKLLLTSALLAVQAPFTRNPSFPSVSCRNSCF